VSTLFYLSAAVAVLSTALAISRVNAVHALLYLIVSLLSVALVFFSLGAPFIAALEVIIYAGAIMVLFIFAVMLLNPDEEATEQERRWLRRRAWVFPSILGALLVGELAYLLARGDFSPAEISRIGPKEIGIALFGPYVLAVQLVSMLLLAALIGACHLGRRRTGRRGGNA
jgi:NADH-quinone oxidoreductase subunit J